MLISKLLKKLQNNFFNRSEISIKFCVFDILFDFFQQKKIWGLFSILRHFLQTLKLNPHRMAQKTDTLPSPPPPLPVSKHT
jgi:hypothetical protein